MTAFFALEEGVNLSALYIAQVTVNRFHHDMYIVRHLHSRLQSKAASK